MMKIPTIKLIPLNKGKTIQVLESKTVYLGRTPECGCLDPRVSRQHAKLNLKADGTVWITGIHVNPTFYKTKSGEIVRLTKDKDYQVDDGDQFGLLPDEYFYSVSIQKLAEEKNENLEKRQNDDTLPASKLSTEDQKEKVTYTIVKSFDQKLTKIKISTSHKTTIAEEQSDIDKSVIIKNTAANDSTQMDISTIPKLGINEQSTINTSTIPKPESEESKNNDFYNVVKPNMDEQLVAIEEKTANENSQVSKNESEAKQRALPKWISNGSASSLSQSDQDKKDLPFKRKRVIIYDSDDNDEGENSKTSNQAKKVRSRARRQRCSYGLHCYRMNPVHRQEESHPGDSDWEDESTASAKKTKSECPYGDECYRKNPDHIKTYHSNREKTSSSKRTTRKRSIVNDDDDGLPNEYDYNDSFIDDEDLTDSQSSDETDIDSGDEWKPKKLTEESSSQESDIEILKKEAKEFIEPSKKKSSPSNSTDED